MRDGALKPCCDRDLGASAELIADRAVQGPSVGDSAGSGESLKLMRTATRSGKPLGKAHPARAVPSLGNVCRRRIRSAEVWAGKGSGPRDPFPPVRPNASRPPSETVATT